MRRHLSLFDRLYGSRLSAFIAYSASPEPFTLYDRVHQAATVVAVGNEEPEHLLKRAAGHHVLALMDYEHEVQYDVEPRRIRHYIIESVPPRRTSLAVALVEHDAALTLFDKYVRAMRETNPHEIDEDSPLGPEYLFKLRKGERLYTAHFGLNRLPRRASGTRHLKVCA